MTLANLQKHHARLRWLVSGEFTERDFDYKINASENPHGQEKGEGGWSTMGDFENKVGNKRKELIIIKAKRALEIIEDNYPEFKVEEKSREEVKDLNLEKLKTKSKEKK